MTKFQIGRLEPLESCPRVINIFDPDGNRIGACVVEAFGDGANKATDNALARAIAARFDLTVVHVLPDPVACDHDWQGWREFEDGRGGERVCAKCGMGAMHHSLMVGP